MDIVEKILRGSPHRISRFHNEKGDLVDPAGFLHAPRAFGTAAMKALFGFRPRRPMISYRATRVIAGRLTPESVVVEFGSGMSTLWFARRCRSLLSIEDDSYWHALVERRLRSDGASHVRYELRSAATYSQVHDLPDASVDFVLVDGSQRARCITAILPKIRAGGALYLDNSDKDMTRPDGDLRQAEAALRAGVEARGGTIRLFTDFSPTNFFVEQGMLAIL